MIDLFFLVRLLGSGMSNMHFFENLDSFADGNPFGFGNELHDGSEQPRLIGLDPQIDFKIVHSEAGDRISGSISNFVLFVLHYFNPGLIFVAKIIDFSCLRSLYFSIPHIFEAIFLVQSFIPFETILDFVLKSSGIIRALMTNLVQT